MTQSHPQFLSWNPNWFFSALAQSAAVIVGVGAAFLFARATTLEQLSMQENSNLERERRDLDSIDFCPGHFDEGTWRLIVEIMPYATDQVFPTTWNPENDGIEIQYSYGKISANWSRTETWRGIGWAYLADIPLNQTYIATFKQET